MTTLSPYSIGEIPNFDPCDKCLIRVACTQVCKPKLRFDKNQPKSEKIVIRARRRRKKK